jgi:hypothetical protein
MKRRDVLISIAIVVAALLACYFVFRQTGCIEIETPGVELRLQRAFFGQVTVTSLQDPLGLPARVYTPQSLTIMKHADGDTWKLTSSGPWGDLARIKVAPGRTTSLAVGPPFRIAPKADVGGGKGYVELQILGRAGERYDNVIRRNGSRIPPPKVRILDENGNVLASGQFAYG